MADFELKKYEIVKPFGSYRKGQFVAFNGAHAKQFAEFIKECYELTFAVGAERFYDFIFL